MHSEATSLYAKQVLHFNSLGLKPVAVKRLAGNTRLHHEMDRSNIFETERVDRNKRCAKQQLKMEMQTSMT